MKKISEKTTGTFLTLAAVIILSPDALLISSIGVDTWTLIFWRGLLTATTLTVSLVVAHGKGFLREVLKTGFPGLLVGLFFAVSTISFVSSVRLTTAANTLVIVAAMPLVAAIFTGVFLAEQVPKRTWVAVVSGFAGITLVFIGSVHEGNPLGDFFALATAILMAANFVIIRRNRRVNMIPAVVLSGLLTTIFTAFLINPFTLAPRDILMLSAIGSVVLPVPLVVMTISPKLIPAAEVSLIMLLETFLGPLWVWLALGEQPGTETVLGGAVLMITLGTHAWAGMRKTGNPA